MQTVRVDMVKKQKEKKKTHFQYSSWPKEGKEIERRQGKIKHKEQKYKDNLVIN